MTRFAGSAQLGGHDGEGVHRWLPEELEESARLDGATTWGVFRRIVFPMIAPMSATVAIFAFLAS